MELSYRYKPARPYHVAFEDSYIRAQWDGINALCRFNGVSIDATGEKIRRDGLWCVYEFGQQLDAMMAWDRFQGRWLIGGGVLVLRAAGEYAEDERSQPTACVEREAARPQKMIASDGSSSSGAMRST